MRIGASELAVRAGIAEVPLKLRSCNFNLKSVFFGFMKLDLRPQAIAANVEPKEEGSGEYSPCNL